MSKFWQGCGGQISPSEIERFENSGLYVAEPKYDGIWGACTTLDGKQHFFSRNGKEKNMDMPLLPDGVVLTGELGYGSQESKTRAEQLGHQFMDIFDILAINGGSVHHLDDNDRRNLLVSFWENLAPQLKDYFPLAPRVSTGFRKLYESEAEGIVLKQIKDRKPTPYKIGSRNPYWIKVKRVLTVDMVIIDYEISDADSYKGMGIAKNITCGAWKDGHLLPLVDVGSMPVALKADIVRNWENYKGGVAEIACFKVFKSGSLRHPSLLKIREDKESNDCTWETIASLM